MVMDRQQHTRNDEDQVKSGEEVDAWRCKLRWSTSNRGWIAKTDGVTIFVSEQTYEQHLKRYLAEQGMEWKTWTQIMRAAEDEWQQQYEVVDRFQKNLNYWLESGDREVWIYRRTERARI